MPLKIIKKAERFRLPTMVFLSVLLFVFYFIALRPGREIVFSGVVEYLWNTGSHTEHVAPFVQKMTSVSLMFSLQDKGTEYMFRMPFGQYFLIAMMAWPFFDSRKYMSALIALNGLFTLFIWISLFVYLNGFAFGLYTGDFLSRYMYPLLTLGYAPLWLLIKRLK